MTQTQWYHVEPHSMTPNLGSGPPFWTLAHFHVLLQLWHVVNSLTVRCGQQSLTVSSCQQSSL